MNVSLLVSLRYLHARRKQLFLSVISIISILGVALGVGALVITLSVMNGFQTDLKNKILASNPHITIIPKDTVSFKDYESIKNDLQGVKGVQSSAPFIYGQGMLKKKKNTNGVIAKGISSFEDDVTSLTKYITQGRMVKEGQKEILIGRELSRNMGLFVGDEVVFISPKLSFNVLGQVPKWGKLKVVGIIETGMYEYDLNQVYIDLSTAEDLFEMKGQINGIGVKIEDAYEADIIANRINNMFSKDWFARSWLMMNQSLFSALKLEKFVMFIILILIIIVAAFGIISSLMLMTIEKIRDIGIMRAFGMPRKVIAKIFIYQGLGIGLVGTLLGLLFGLGSVFILSKYNFIKLPADIYYITNLPVQVELLDIVFICIVAVIITLLATLFPAYKASRLDPSVAVRYE